jgi:hypothetical protein
MAHGASNSKHKVTFIVALSCDVKANFEGGGVVPVLKFKARLRAYKFSITEAY